MSLKTFNPETHYDYNNCKHSLLEDFYIPALSESITYKRLAGYFTSGALAAAAVGYSKFINNDGKVKLICCFQLNNNDQKVIKEALDQKEKEIINEIDTIQDAIKKGHLDILAWMIKYDKIEIKIAIVPLGIEHQKKGIFIDKEDNMISFSGSDNETAKGWLSNDDSFHVFCSWKSDKDHLYEDINTFKQLWNNQAKRTQVYSISEAFKKRLIKNAPGNEEFKILNNKMFEEAKRLSREELKKIKAKRLLESEKKQKINLWDNQKGAIKKWEDEDKKGILRIATGCGKTIIGVYILKENLKKRGINLLVSPREEINTQWIQDFNKFLDIDRVIFTKDRKWIKMANNTLSHYEEGRVNSFIIVTTYKMLPKLVGVLDTYNIFSKNNLIIADEAHSLGAEETSKILENKSFADNFQNRLGLSATPENLYDSERNNKLYGFLGKIILDYGIKEGIRDRILCKYEYHLNIVKMTKEDYKHYLKLTKNLRRLYYKTKDKEEKNKLYKLLINKRARIIKESNSKFIEFDNILKNLKKENKISKTLVFGENHKHLDKIYETIEKNNIPSAKIIEKTTPLQRQKIFESIKDGVIDIITSTSILDEGINIKSLKNAIILASSTNPRQYIQRRGRVLRFQKDDPFKVAQIYDFFVIPPNFEEDNYELDKKIIEKELARIKEFVDFSDNSYNTKFKNPELLKILKRFDLEKKFGTR